MDTKNQIIKAASQMFLHGANRMEVLKFLQDEDVPEPDIDSIATEAYRLIKAERNAKLNLFDRRLTFKEIVTGIGLFIIAILLEECNLL